MMKIPRQSISLTCRWKMNTLKKCSMKRWSLDETKARNDFPSKAAVLYQQFQRHYKNRFKWINSDYFLPLARRPPGRGCGDFVQRLKKAGTWDWEKDNKLKELIRLVDHIHPREKVLIFTQYADTVHYLESCLQKCNINSLAGVAGSNR